MHSPEEGQQLTQPVVVRDDRAGGKDGETGELGEESICNY